MLKKMYIKNKIITISILVLLITLVGYLTITFARYVGNNVWDYYLASNGFYFESDTLTGDTITNYNWNKSRVYFDISNFVGDNVTENTIDYTAKCEIVSSSVSGVSCSVNGSTGTYVGNIEARSVCINTSSDGVDVDFYDEMKCKESGYKWSAEKETDTLYFQVLGLSTTASQSDLEVKVTVESTSPYVKTLTSNFYLHNDSTVKDELFLEYESFSEYEKVIVTNTGDNNKLASLDFDSDKVRIEKEVWDSEVVDINGFISGIEFSVNAHSSRVFYFHKTDASIVLSESDFTLMDLDDVYPYISSVNLVSLYNATEVESVVFDKSTITSNNWFQYSSSNALYEVTIKNDSPYDYIMRDIEETIYNKNISFRLNDFTYGTTIPASSEVTFTITLSSLINNQTGKLGIRFLYNSPNEIPQIDTVLVGATSEVGTYIKTGFFPSSESKIIIDFTFNGPRGSSVWLFSSRRAYKNQMFGIAWNTTESLLQFHNVSYNLGSTGYQIGNRYVAEISKDALVLNGVTYSNPPDTVWVSIFEFYMFANNEARTVRGHTNGQATIHSAQIYESGVLVLDAIPVILETGEVVYWNNVNDLPLTNVGDLVPIYE